MQIITFASMKTIKNILFYFSLTLAVSGYINCEFSDIFFSANINLETLDDQPESESREYEERAHAEEYSTSNSSELKDFPSSKQKQHYFYFLFIPNDFASLVWTPPKLS